jgi:hypothetical protein
MPATIPVFSHKRRLMYDKYMHVLVPFKFEWYATQRPNVCSYHSNLNGTNINDREGKRGMTDEGVIGHWQ